MEDAHMSGLHLLHIMLQHLLIGRIAIDVAKVIAARRRFSNLIRVARTIKEPG
jgi:hypothetical protein